jgi:DNA-directed RNA polymerase subunit RPC12/RpoP
MWNTSITTLWGKSPKVEMICGKCSYHFSKRFDLIEFKVGYPRVICPYCNTLNSVPIVMEDW